MLVVDLDTIFRRDVYADMKAPPMRAASLIHMEEGFANGARLCLPACRPACLRGASMRSCYGCNRMMRCRGGEPGKHMNGHCSLKITCCRIRILCTCPHTCAERALSPPGSDHAQAACFISRTRCQMDPPSGLMTRRGRKQHTR